MVILESHGNTQIGAMWPRLSLLDGPLHKLNEAKVFRICKDFLFLAVVVFEAWHTQKYEMHWNPTISELLWIINDWLKPNKIFKKECVQTLSSLSFQKEVGLSQTKYPVDHALSSFYTWTLGVSTASNIHQYPRRSIQVELMVTNLPLCFASGSSCCSKRLLLGGLNNTFHDKFCRV